MRRHATAARHVKMCALRARQIAAREGVKGVTTCGPKVLMGRRAVHLAAYPGLWEFAPSGGAEPGKSPSDLIQEELIEETGYEAADWEELASGPTSPGLSNESIVFFRGRNLWQVGKGGGEGSEEIIVHEVPVAEVPAWLKSREQAGYSIDTKIYAALFFL